MKDKLLLFCLYLVLICIVSGCVSNTTQQKEQAKDGDIQILNEVVLDGIYNPVLQSGKIFMNGTWYNYTNFQYVKDNVNYNTGFINCIVDVFDWIRIHTARDCTILSWWDYGGMIEGYAEREAIAVYPSLSLIHTIGSYNILNDQGKKLYIEEHEWTDDEIIRDIANVLTTDNFSDNNIQNIIEEYNVSYIFTRTYDTQISNIFFSTAEQSNVPTNHENETLIFKMWESNPDISGLNLVYTYTPQGNTDSNVNFSIVRIFEVENFFSYASFSEAVYRLDTPTKVINHMNSYFNFVYHDGCVSYEPEQFYELKEGDCKDYATFFSYVLDYHGFDADIVTFTYYDQDNMRAGHVVTLFNDTNGVLKYQSNCNIFGPVDSVSDLLEQEKIRLNATRIGDFRILDSGSTYCCTSD